VGASKAWAHFDVIDEEPLDVPILAYICFFLIGYSSWFVFLKRKRGKRRGKEEKEEEKEEGRRKKEEGRRKKEEGRRNKEQGTRNKEGKRKRSQVLTLPPPHLLLVNRLLSNSIYLELPFLIGLPSKEAIATQISFATQSANFLIPLYHYLSRFRWFSVNYVISFLTLLAVITSVCLAISWQFISPENPSIGAYFVILSTVSGITGCLSGVSFWEFASSYPSHMITSMAIGFSFSSILPAILASIQLPGPSARFGFSAFFYIIAALLLASFAAFLLTLFSPLTRGLKKEEWVDETRLLIRPVAAYKGTFSSSRKSHRHAPRRSSRGRHGNVNTTPAPDPTIEIPEGNKSSSLRTAGSSETPSDDPWLHSESSESDFQPEFSLPGDSSSRPRVKSLHSITRGEQEDLKGEQEDHKGEQEDHKGKQHPPFPAPFRVPSAEFDLPEPSRDISMAWKELVIMLWISLHFTFPYSVAPYLTRGFERNVLSQFVISGLIGNALGRLSSGFVLYLPHLPLLLLQLFFELFLYFGPVFHWTDWAGWLIVIFNFFFNFLYGLQSTLLLKNASLHIDVAFSQKLCRWLGTMERLGALISSIVAIGLVFGGVFD